MKPTSFEVGFFMSISRGGLEFLTVPNYLLHRAKKGPWITPGTFFLKS